MLLEEGKRVVEGGGGDGLKGDRRGGRDEGKGERGSAEERRVVVLSAIFSVWLFTFRC